MLSDNHVMHSTNQTEMNMKKRKQGYATQARNAGFPDRVRFNWGFHDAAFDASRSNARITNSAMQDIKHVSPSFDKSYHDGYEMGLIYVREGKDTNSSESAWHQQA